eukprot:11696405-Alexandrium_andersonii.AAC.1
MRRLLDVVRELETSALPGARALWAALPCLEWTVIREPLALLEAGHLGALQAYASALSEGLGNTLGLENTFNDLRDNEARGARHK